MEIKGIQQDILIELWTSRVGVGRAEQQSTNTSFSGDGKETGISHLARDPHFTSQMSTLNK